MIHMTPDSMIDRNLDRACELLGLKMITAGTDREINSFAELLHKRLDRSIDRTLHRMESEIKVRESLNNPKIAKQNVTI